MLPLIQAGGEVFFLILFLLCLQHIFKLAGDVGFHICVHRSDINNGVILALPQMTDLLGHPVAIPEYSVDPYSKVSV